MDPSKEFGGFTTKAAQWEKPNLQPWTSHGSKEGIFNDGYDIHFDEDPPLSLERYIGEGNYGSVSAMLCKETGQLVAVKRIRIDTARDSMVDLRNEVGSLRELSHYHVLRIVGTYMFDDYFHLMTLPVAHCSLYSYLTHATDEQPYKLIQQCGPPDELLPILFGCLANGLRYIHQARIKHMDIKPDNIILIGRRVLFADFGIARRFATRSTSDAPVSRTHRYAAPEIARSQDHNRASDIFSLGCVFAEIFAVLRRCPYLDFRVLFPESYNKCVGGVLVQLENIATVERCDVQLLSLIRCMLDDWRVNRPDADEVWKRATTCTSSSTTNARTCFCGPCCMPFLTKADSGKPGVNLDLTRMPYHTDMPLADRPPFGKDPNFNTWHEMDKPLGFEWVRNLRHGSYSIHDVVKCGSQRTQLGRKIVLKLPNQTFDVEAAAKREAGLTWDLVHRHVIKIKGTYRQGNVFGLLFQPAADYDLRTYLQEIELQNAKASSPNLKFLAESFGCLANALRYIHGKGIFHGDIKPENILIHEGRVFMAKFGQASNSTHPVVVHAIERKKQFDSSDLYRSPEWQHMKAATEPMSDVFSLGCTFIEMYTVLSGRRVYNLASSPNAAGRTPYRDTIPALVEWLANLKTDSETDFKDILGRMIDRDPERRFSAAQIHQKLLTCRTHTNIVFCGSFCRQ